MSASVETPTGAPVRTRVPSLDAPLLSVRDLRLHFRTKRGIARSVDGVSFDIAEGETLGLVGETGSGKTVTARSLIRLVPSPPGIYAGGLAMFRPKRVCTGCDGAGRVRGVACAVCGGEGRTARTCSTCDAAGCPICGGTGRETVELLSMDEREMRRVRGDQIAMIFQDPGKALNPSLPIREQMAEAFAEHRSGELLRDAGLDDPSVLVRRDARRRATFWERRLLRIPPLRDEHRRVESELDDRIAQALADTRIPNPRKIMHSYPHELSGGMKQRVMIAQALACDPDLLIADEPTTALDVTIQARILDLLAELQERHGTAVLYISHDLSLVRSISDRVAVMYAGQLAEVGTTERIFAEPMHPYTRGLLGAIPGRQHRRGTLVAIDGSVPELIDPPPMCRFHTRCPFAAPACSSFVPPLRRRGADGARSGGSGPDGQDVACLIYDDAAELGVDASEMPSGIRRDPEAVP
ncbi:MAG TPA: oligopeptide/dipeptide ABC transporter ATP-binding protein [Actinomycetota bacterium]|nr:oligopeptide/dipeptide ABC transporter ATP-binding protein [Actinomycetota bacterium]